MMRTVVLALSAFTLVSAAPAPQSELDMPGYQLPAEPWVNVDEALRRAECERKIRQVRDANDQPELDRNPATGDDGLMIAAVDKSIENCPVLVMHSDKSDIRPVPKGERAHKFMPAISK